MSAILVKEKTVCEDANKAILRVTFSKEKCIFVIILYKT